MWYKSVVQRSRKWISRLSFMILGSALLGLLLANGCGRVPDPWEGKAGPPRVVASFPPLYCFTQNVAGEHAGIISICLDKGPHEHEINPVHDLEPLKKANVFFTSGLGLDDVFCEKLKDTAGNDKLKMVEVSEAAFEGDKHDMLMKLSDAEKQHEGDGHHHGDYDPHVWMGIPQAIEMVKVIRDELCDVDPPHAADYKKNAAAYIKKLEALLESGKAALKPRHGEKLRVISNHESLGYFARAFDLEVVGYLEAEPGLEPDPTKLGKLAKLCKEKPIQAIAVEPQYDRRPADALLSHLKGQNISPPEIVEIDPLETATPNDLKDPEWYENKMHANIDRLKKLVP
jgi:ABC-type Zn uptake system ZnuABC Zn-binding protein ZnuA